MNWSELTRKARPKKLLVIATLLWVSCWLNVSTPTLKNMLP